MLFLELSPALSETTKRGLEVAQPQRLHPIFGLSGP